MVQCTTGFGGFECADDVLEFEDDFAHEFGSLRLYFVEQLAFCIEVLQAVEFHDEQPVSNVVAFECRCSRRDTEIAPHSEFHHGIGGKEFAFSQTPACGDAGEIVIEPP